MNTKGINAAILGSIKTEKKPRINWRKEIKKERNRTLDEAICAMRLKIRSAPVEWRRGFYSAITTLEIMKNE